MLAHSINKTNNSNGLSMIVYCPHDKENTIFVREENEFFEKFENVNMPNTSVQPG